MHLHKNVPVIFRFIFNLKLLRCGTWDGGCFGPKIHCHCKFTVVNNDDASLNKEKKNDLLGKNHFKKGLLILESTIYLYYLYLFIFIFTFFNIKVRLTLGYWIVTGD